MRLLSERKPRGFSIIEMLVVVAIIAVLVSLLIPIALEARTAARVSRAHVELRQLTIALEIYRDCYRVFPRARSLAVSVLPDISHYSGLPPELVETGCLDSLPEDVFNPGHTYKYSAPCLFLASAEVVAGPLSEPEQPPEATDPDRPLVAQAMPLVGCAVWSVGPSGAAGAWLPARLPYALSRRDSHPSRGDGIIVHYYRNQCWHASP